MAVSADTACQAVPCTDTARRRRASSTKDQLCPPMPEKISNLASYISKSNHQPYMLPIAGTFYRHKASARDQPVTVVKSKDDAPPHYFTTLPIAGTFS